MRRRAAILGEGLQALASKYPAKITEIRGRGFLRGIRFDDQLEAGALVVRLREHKMLAVPAAENTLRLLPPLIISRDEIDILMAALHRQLNAA